jgi:hypothetical protein
MKPTFMSFSFSNDQGRPFSPRPGRAGSISPTPFALAIVHPAGQGVAQTRDDMRELVVCLANDAHVTGRAIALDGGFVKSSNWTIRTLQTHYQQ